MSSQTPQSAGKVAVTCPLCGFKQLESPYAKSTFCRKCGGHYEPGKSKPILTKEEPSFFERLGGIFSRQKTRDITCFDCAAVQTVSNSSTSSICPHCSAYIDLSDFKIKTAFSRMIQTQGTVTIGSNADVTSSKIACREAYVGGKLRGNLLCTGTAYVKWKGKISGSIEAKQLVVAKRSEVEFVRPIKVKSAEISGKVSGSLHVDGTLKITKRGWLEGSVYARGIVVEKGGVFLGELVIGQASFVQPELAEAEPLQPSKPQPKGKKNGKAAAKLEEKPGQQDLGLGL